MKSVALLILVAGCSSVEKPPSEPPPGFGACEPAWNEGNPDVHTEWCESGCVYKPAQDTSAPCSFADETGAARQLPWSFLTYRKIRGVCALEREFDAKHAIVRFFPCE